METPTSQEKQVLSLKDDTTKNKIRTLYLDGHTLAEVGRILEIPKGTIDSAYYLNIHSFRDFVKELKKERFMIKAEKVSDAILDLTATNNAKMLSIQQKEAEFIRETLLKDEGYSKRIETIGLNINKNEPLDDEQKKKLDNLLKKTGNSTTTVDSTVIDVS